MMKVLLLAMMATVVASDLDTDWIIFKAKYNKTHKTPELEEIRKYIWLENKKYIEDHNKLYRLGLSSFYLGENEYADMTPTEFASKMTGMRKTVKLEATKNVALFNASLPDTVDWRTKGFVTPVKNQGQCGSCWAFSATGSMEGQHFKKAGRLVSLSESNLVDCSTSYGNYGCRGGWPVDAYKYVIARKGIDTEQGYPYTPRGNNCRYNPRSVGAKFSNYKVVVPKGSELSLQRAAAEVGPISVCIDAEQRSFMHYRGGVYDEPLCRVADIDHCVLLVGYGTRGSMPYWLVKNSWGTTWGMEGYIMMSRNKKNQCGIATYASYPIV